MAMTWAFKKQLKIFIFLAVIIFAIVGYVIYSFLPAPSCTDGKLNQHEERIDCGGECDACVIDPKNLVVTWARAFELTPGHYEVAALIDNINSEYGSREIGYTFILYENNAVVGSKEGKTFLNPREKFIIYENDIPTGTHTANRAVIEFKDFKWRKIQADKAKILVSSKSFANTPNGNAHAVLKNTSLFPINNIYAAIVLKDSLGNAIGVSSTKVDSIKGEASKDLFFTWRNPVFASSTEVYIRTDLTQ